MRFGVISSEVRSWQPDVEDKFVSELDGVAARLEMPGHLSRRAPRFILPMGLLMSVLRLRQRIDSLKVQRDVRGCQSVTIGQIEHCLPVRRMQGLPAGVGPDPMF